MMEQITWKYYFLWENEKIPGESQVSQVSQVMFFIPGESQVSQVSQNPYNPGVTMHEGN